MFVKHKCPRCTVQNLKGCIQSSVGLSINVTRWFWLWKCENPQTYMYKKIEIINRQHEFQRPYIDLDIRAQIFAYQYGHHRRKKTSTINGRGRLFNGSSIWCTNWILVGNINKLMNFDHIKYDLIISLNM